LWIALAVVVAGSFGILGLVGISISSNRPPIPDRFEAGGEVLFDSEDIRGGLRVWAAMGGMEVGSVWGHGAYVAPDWTADWLHREALLVRAAIAEEVGATDYRNLDLDGRAVVDRRLELEYRTNTWDPDTRTVTLSPARAAAAEQLVGHYADVFERGRERYAIPEGAVTDPRDQREMASFFFWTAWAASTERPGTDATYTRNWPHEPLVGNLPTGDTVLWSVISVVLLLAGIVAMVWYFGSKRTDDEEEDLRAAPDRDPLLGWEPTPSQRATRKYFYLVGGLFVFQILMGVVTAHYAVEGDGLYGIPLSEFLPYAVTRTWHTQLGILWIATAWLATGLYVAPAVGGREPKGQKALVDVLFWALIVVVIGSMAGQWLSIQGRLDRSAAFWVGHQGYEYVDLGRLFQFGLMAGLVLWCALVLRGVWPALRSGPRDQRSLLGLFLLSAVAITGFYGAAFGIWERTDLTMAEYWRWWVVHLWVEGFFEVFATVVMAFLFARLGLIRSITATRAALFSTSIFLAGGIVGTFHHLYFSGTPAVVTALGASFSALECVPLVLIGFEAWRHLRMARVREWVAAYRWAIWFFVAVAFWNAIGAGLFGFLINPPIALYYMQGLNTTPVHGHTALFGVYGMLGIGLMLFCIRALEPGRVWKERAISVGFWCLNIGLGLQVLVSLLPIGLWQAWVAIERGTWYARSAEFLHGSTTMDVLRWLRVPGDTIFAVGALAIGWFMVGLLTRRSHGDGDGAEVRAGSPVHHEVDRRPVGAVGE
jgi:nitric oxide reductase subunit B